MTATLQRSIVVDERAVGQAQAVEAHIAAHTDSLAVVSAAPGTAVKLPAELADVLVRVIAAVSAGGTVTVGVLPRELSTTEAARQLAISRPTLMKMIREKKIPAHKVGSHTRVLTEDIRQFKDRIAERKVATLIELRELDEEAGLDT